MIPDTRFDETLLSRIEDAGINASAPPQQRWIDGWLLRFSPGKAKRARCINAVAAGRLPIDEKLRLCRPVFDAAGMPLLVRITPFSQPAGLERHLIDAGMTQVDDTRVMVLRQITSAPAAVEMQPIKPIGHAEFARHIGLLRGSSPSQRQAHAERLERSPVPINAFVVTDDGNSVIGCGQFAVEADLVGLYDILIAPSHRGLGVAASLCRQMLRIADAASARTAYLQVEADNHPARRLYRRLGFIDAYSYHSRGAGG